MVKSILLVAAGGAFGAALRYVFSIYFVFNNTIFSSTLMVNVLGCFTIGVLFPVLTQPENNNLKLLLISGLLGGFTTFSALGIETILLIKQNNILLAVYYIFTSNFLCIAAAFLGYKIMVH